MSDTMICPTCLKDVTVGQAHLCGLSVVDAAWQVKLSGANITTGETPPSIEEYEAAVEKHKETLAADGRKGYTASVPAEIVAYDSIIIGERYRKEYKDITELADSINKFGLLQYPVIDEQNNLVAGGRRMRAIETLAWRWVPVVRKKYVTELRLREMELEENIQRSDLSWAEQCQLKDEVYRLKVSLYGEKGTGRAAANNPGGVSQKDVASIFGDSPSNFTLDLQLARALVDIPELAECATKDAARKKLKQIQEQLIVDELYRRHREKNGQVNEENGELDLTDGQTGSESVEGVQPRKSTLYSRADSAFVVHDAIDGLRNLPENGPFGFVNIDTPYAIDLNNTKRNDGKEDERIMQNNYIEWTPEEYLTTVYNEFSGENEYRGLAFETAKEVFRICDNVFMTWWFAEQWQQQLFEMLTYIGWKVDPVPCIWYTGNQGQTNQPELYLARTYEPFFLCRKGQPIMQKRGRSNVFFFPKLTADKKIHPTEKPEPLMVEIFNTFAPPNSNILVPYLGSGNDILAAYNTQRDALGFDLNAEVKKRFLLRVAEREGFTR